ncbi:hypothetical protein L3X38_038168 [Prunus dulcis]|uniref:Uncharacterized protein n=1 Tax=Prunus dulcis TaxID=3755 RepID=A0AAD4YRA5_PRUDU|nr:hypothetical protein L3X38_038168 [Prunus dulcis]
MTDEQMWGYQSQCLNAMVGIHNGQMARFQAMSCEIYEKTATLELSGKRIKECETELEQQELVDDYEDDYEDARLSTGLWRAQMTLKMSWI